MRLEYLAGLFDGEGCFLIAKSSPGKSHTIRPYRYQARAALNIRDKVIADLLVESFGGTARFCKRDNPNYSPIYSWTCMGKGLDKMLELLDGRLLIKQAQCDTLKLFQEVKKRVGNRSISDSDYAESEKLYFKMRELNKRGPK